MPEPVIQRSFAGGELAPSVHARADAVKYTQGLRTCRNFFVRREGGVSNRAGFGFIEACKDDAAGKRLMRFVSSTAGDGILIEIGSGYFRFFHNGAAVTLGAVAAYNNATTYVPGDIVVSGGTNYYCTTTTVGVAPPGAPWYPLTSNILEIPTPYGVNDKFKWNQSGNVITITHRNQQPRELIYTNLTRWVLQTVTTVPTIAAPAGGAGVAGAPGALTYSYIVTAAQAETYEESAASAPIVIAACAEPTAAAPNALTWGPVAGAAEYYVYLDRYQNGVYGFVGTASGASFKDANFVPDFNVTPPVPRVLFTTTNDFPETSANYQQRRFFGNTNHVPDSVWGSRTGFVSNFGIASPLQDDDAITFRLAGNNFHPVRWMAAMKAGLVLMTDGGEWTVTGAGGPKNPITPNSIDTEQETYVGVAADVRPVLVGNTMLYVQARGNVMRELRFDQAVEGLAGRDLSIYASHLTRRKTLVAIDFQQTPDSIIWCVRSDGVLLGLTYIPEQEIWGWHRHDTYTNLAGSAGSAQSLIEDVCVVPEAEQEFVYVIVARTIAGITKRFIERIEPRESRVGFFNADTFFVDCGLSYSGAPVSAVAGLDHLEGQVVAVVADGVTVFNGDPTDATNAALYTVTAGQIDLPAAASNVHIGLPIRYGEIELLDLDVAGSNIRTKKKRVSALTLLVERSSRSFSAGPDSSNLRTFTSQAWEPTGTTADGPFELLLTSEFTETGRVLIRQVDPMPLTILGVVPQIEMGG